ncbi:Rieske (2Fe-2S) protein [Novosphingobium album (ex Liu et al. 2023)]|uniref:Rieske (2Fe-2S) protein n=1 Tax=Novosphingobium album (ex Liu et al. 2023) TaxID=3031130 RepID=A0ABT5WJM5_9SPHN|nr:Rieske (2Fe-2S) protein [Novosphingobium album (ex Liu et al. 2023)]MDE8650250.1 Rieske (2Fe-2S) protein [Novosphingobium album (ex Liu et al. 2023)]
MDYVKVAAVADVAAGRIVPVEAGGLKLLLTQVDGTFYAAQRKCPHLGFNLCRGAIEGRAIVCPLHKARFDLATGAIERDPRLLFIGMKARTDLATYPVRVEGGEVFVGLPDQDGRKP